MCVFLATGFLAKIGEFERLLWLQAPATVVMIVAGIVALQALYRLKKCAEPETPQTAKLGKVFAIVLGAIIFGSFLALALRVNTPHGWHVFALMFLAGLLGVLWPRRRKKV